MKVIAGRAYRVANKPRELGPQFHYLIGNLVEVTSTELVHGKVPIKLLCEVPEGSMHASRIRPDLLEEQKG